MFEEKALNPNQFLVNEKNRKSTDVICTVIGAAFALTLFIAACIMWNKENFENRFFNVRKNAKGEVCTGDTQVLVHDHTNVTNSACVKHCPTGFAAVEGFCLPENPDKLNQYLQNSDISAPIQYGQFKWVLFYTFIVSLGLGVFWAMMVQCFPRYVSMLAHIQATLTLIAFGVLLLVLGDSFFSSILWLKITLAVICFLIALISIIMLCVYANEIKLQSLFLDYSTRFFNQHSSSIIYLILYMIFTVGLVALIVWQHCCFTSRFGQSRDFWNFNNVGVWEILNVLEFIWGVQFLRDSYYFCVGGNAVDYYWREEDKLGVLHPYRRLLCNHWGSVVGGSFLNAFFELPTLIAELLICHPTACCSKLGTTCYNSCNWFSCFFDLVRTDSYAYANITGIPFCNASRECKKICENSKHFVGVHSPIKHYRFVAFAFILTLALIAAWFILRARLLVYGFWHIVLIIVVIYITIAWFIDLHCSAAQALQTSYLCEHELEPNHGLMQRLHLAYVADLDQWQKRQLTDGNI